jgi:hypothetical protein
MVRTKWDENEVRLQALNNICWKFPKVPVPRRVEPMTRAKECDHLPSNMSYYYMNLITLCIWRRHFAHLSPISQNSIGIAKASLTRYLRGILYSKDITWEGTKKQRWILSYTVSLSWVQNKFLKILRDLKEKATNRLLKRREKARFRGESGQ